MSKKKELKKEIMQLNAIIDGLRKDLDVVCCDPDNPRASAIKNRCMAIRKLEKTLWK